MELTRTNRSGGLTTYISCRRSSRSVDRRHAATCMRGSLLRFGESGVEATLRVEPRTSWIRLTVGSVNGPEIESLVFVNVPLTLKARPEEPFGACALSLNLITRIDQLPALQTELRAAAYRKFGIVGAKVALVGMPPGRMLTALKEVLSEADEMPLCKVAGPWAGETPFVVHGDHITVKNASEKEVDLLTPLRAGATLEDLRQLILDGIWDKPWGHGLAEGIIPLNRVMSEIGG